MKKIITLLLSLVLTLGVFAMTGCNSNKEEVDPNYDMLFDFESREEVSSIKAFWDFGKMQISNENATKGNCSMRLEVHGTYPDYQFAFGDWHMIDDQFLVFYMDDNKHLKTAAPDFAKYSAIEFDVKNDSDRDLPVRIFLSSMAKTADKEDAKEREVNIDLGEKVIKKGEKKTLSYSIGLNARTNMLNGVKYLKLVVPNREEGQTPAVLFIDNMRAKKGDVKEFKKTFNENEIMFFENQQDAQMFTNSFDACQYKSALSFSYNNEMDYATEGSSSLKITHNPSPYLYNWGGTIKAQLSQSYLEKIDFTKHDKAKTVIKADVKTSSDVGQLVHMTLRANDTVLEGNVWAIKDKWGTISIPMSWNTKGDFSKVYELSFRFNEFAEGEPRDVFIDNIRFETK